MRQMLDPADGLPAFLDHVNARSAEYARARDTVKDVVEQQFDAPELPAHVIIDEIWRWLEPRRTRFDRAVHRTYGHLTGGVRKAWETAGKVAPWLPWTGDGEPSRSCSQSASDSCVPICFRARSLSMARDVASRRNSPRQLCTTSRRETASAARQVSWKHSSASARLPSNR